MVLTEEERNETQEPALQCATARFGTGRLHDTTRHAQTAPVEVER